jgi:hypothetical protein
MFSTTLAGVLVTIILVGVTIWLAYANQADELRDDNQQAFADTIPDDISQIRLDFELLRTSVTIVPAQSDPRAMQIEFVGSNESDVSIAWSAEGDTGVLTLVESSVNQVPKLEDYGRGVLTIALPTGITIERFALTGEQGDVSFNMQPLQIQQVDLAVDGGDLALDLPATEVLNGELETGDGAIILQVPQEVALTVSLGGDSGDPEYEYDTLRYDLLRNGTLKRKNVDAFQVGLTISVDDGASLVVTDLE